MATWLWFLVWTIGHKRDKDGNPYPYAELQDPFSCYPGVFGNDQQPKELAIIRRVPHTMAEQYLKPNNIYFNKKKMMMVSKTHVCITR